MKKTIFEEMGDTYIRQGDYLIHCLTLREEEQVPFLVAWRIEILAISVYNLNS